MDNTGTQELIIALINSAQTIAWLSRMPYIYHMIKSFDSVRDKDVAVYVGLLFAVARLSTAVRSILWNTVIGEMAHKPALLVGIVCSMLSALWFGLSRSVGMIFLATIFNWLFNPSIVAIVKIQKVLDRRETEGERAGSGCVTKYITLAAYVAGLYGPFLGGFLADPAAHYRAIFHSALWKAYPYLLPDLVLAVALMVFFVWTALFFQESHPRYADRRDLGLRIVARIKGCFSRNSTDRSSALYTRMADEEAPSSAENSQPEGSELLQYIKSRDDIQPEVTKTIGDEPELPKTDDIEANSIKESSRARARLHVLATAIFSFHKSSLEAIIPVFLAMTFDPSSPLSTGFVYSPRMIALILHLQLLVALVARASVGPGMPFRSKISTTYGFSLLILSFLYPLIPFLARIDRTLSLIIVFLVLMTIAYCTSVVEAGTTIMTDKLAPQTKLRVATHVANALLDIVMGSLGPVFTGLVFGVGLREGNNEIVFWILSGASILGAMVSFLSRA